MRRTATFTAGVVLAATAGTGIAAWGVPALAETTSEQSTDQGTEQGAEQGTEQGTDKDDRRAQVQGALGEALAAELGLDADEVTAALEKVQSELRTEMQAERLAQLEERVAAAVEAGELTQEEADEMLERAESGELRGPRGHGGPGGPGGPGGERSGSDQGGTSESEDSSTSL